MTQIMLMCALEGYTYMRSSHGQRRKDVMSHHGRFERHAPGALSLSGCLFGAAALALWALAGPAQAQGSDKSGEQVVASVCSGCHATGKLGSPKIGDKKAWGARAEPGLTALT
ncbi:MAG TPA: hypothetical protein VII31_01415, partial [Caldimonas sp.]